MSDTLQSDRPYNRVLLEAGLFFRPFKTEDGLRGHVADASSLRFMIEELVAHSAVEVGIAASSVLSGAVSHLPQSLKTRVRILDHDRKVHARCDAVFAEIADELQLVLGQRGVGLAEHGASQIHADAAGLYLDMYPYLLALEYEMEVAVNVTRWPAEADNIRNGLRNPDARAILASISGIARTYGPDSVPAPIIRPDARPALIESFEQLLEDQEYKHLSEQTRLLGIPSRAARAKTEMARYLRRLIAKRGPSQLIDSGSRAISASTSIPVPESGMISRLLERNYLPPVVSFREVIKRAEAAWRLAKPDFAPLDGYTYQVAPGWD